MYNEMRPSIQSFFWAGSLENSGPTYTFAFVFLFIGIQFGNKIYNSIMLFYSARPTSPSNVLRAFYAFISIAFVVC